VALKGSLRNRVLQQELFSLLRRVDPSATAEVPFSHFLPTARKFRADYLCQRLRIIVEVNGGQFTGGRHTRGGKGYETDLTKINLAQAYGYKVFQFTYEMLSRGEHIALLNKFKV
jgi:very-short-patch-repair endonuclease